LRRLHREGAGALARAARRAEDEKQKMKQKYPDYISDYTSTNGKSRYRVRCKIKKIDQLFNNLEDAIAFQKTII
jgi:hypothetical protein